MVSKKADLKNDLLLMTRLPLEDCQDMQWHRLTLSGAGEIIIILYN